MNSYIVAGFRTAVGKATRGGFRFTRPDDLASDVIKHLMASVPNISHEQTFASDTCDPSALPASDT